MLFMKPFTCIPYCEARHVSIVMSSNHECTEYTINDPLRCLASNWVWGFACVDWRIFRAVKKHLSTRLDTLWWHWIRKWGNNLHGVSMYLDWQKVDSMWVGILAWYSLSCWFLFCRWVLLHPRVDEPSYSRTSFSSLHLSTNTVLSLFYASMKDSAEVDFAGTWACSASRMERLMWSVSSSYLQLPLDCLHVDDQDGWIWLPRGMTSWENILQKYVGYVLCSWRMVV